MGSTFVVEVLMELTLHHCWHGLGLLAVSQSIRLH